MLGHLIRADTEDPMRQVCLDSQGRRLRYEHRRVGRPRNHWTESAMQSAYEYVYNADYVADDETCRILLQTAASERAF